MNVLKTLKSSGKIKLIAILSSVSIVAILTVWYSNILVEDEPPASVKTSETKKATPKNSLSDEQISAFINSKPLPDFGSITDTKVKKKAFFEFIYMHTTKANSAVIELSDELKAIKDEGTLAKNKDRITKLAERYRLASSISKDSDKLDKLIHLVQPIPPSLVLAQAANESAWGTSRFAKQASNLFGQWCFTKGCGLVPKQRNAGSTHEVKTFDSPAKSVRAYIFNLNSNSAYSELREIRAQHDLPTGAQLAGGLEKYSERGDEYVKELRAMIKFNKLKEYDQRYFESLNQ